MNVFFRLAAGVGFAGMSAVAATSVAFAAPPVALVCTPGSGGSTSYTVPDGNAATFFVQSDAGASVGFYATLTNPAGTGSLTLSGGAASTILTFPTKTSAVISTPLNGLDPFVLLPTDTTVTLSVVCNPSSAETVSDLSGNSATSTQIVRDSVPTYLKNFVRRVTSGVEITAQQYQQAIQFAVDRLGMDVAVVEGMLNDSRFAYNTYNSIGWLMSYKSSYAASGLITGADAVSTYPDYVVDFLVEIKSLEVEYNQRGPMTAGDRARESRYLGYAASTSASAAVTAIDEAMGFDRVVQGSFNMLGYGPNGQFSGETILGEGDNWWVVASAIGAISQTSAATGDSRSVSGRGSINIITALNPDLTVGLALSLGATSDARPGIDDTAYHYAANGVVSYRLSPALTMTGQLGYELTSHNYDNGVGTGSGFSHYYNAGLGLEGDVALEAFRLTPRLDVEIVQESAASVTLSDATVLEGFDRTTGKATVGGVIGWDHVADAGDRAIVVSPSLGADVTLSLAHKTTTAGVSSVGSALGLGLTAGIGFAFDGGLDLSLSSRLSLSGDTVGASVSGGVSAAF